MTSTFYRCTIGPPITVSHKFQRTRRWMPCQPFKRSRKLTACCPVANIRLSLESSLDRQACGKVLTEKLHQLFQVMWQHETLRAPPLFIYRSAKEAAGPVKTSVEYPCCRPQARPWPELLWALSQATLGEVSYQRASMVPERSRHYQHGVCCRQLEGKGLEENTLTSTLPMLIWPRPSTMLISREGQWRIMAKYGWPRKFIAMIRQFHDGMLAR